MRRQIAQPVTPAFAVNGEGNRLFLEGALDIRTLVEARESLRGRLDARGRSRGLDLSRLTRLDTPGALFLCRLRDDDHVSLTGVRAEHKGLLELVGGLDARPLPRRPAIPRWRALIIGLGKGGHQTWRDALDIITFVGRTAGAIGNAFAHPRRLRPASISRQIADTGINALPIVGLLAVMISIVIAYQGVVQLRPYGSEDLTVNLVAVSMLREMGVLVTAIIVASRTGSAFTAEIGVMQAREEIDALRVMGMDPMQLLVVPRVVALVMTLPLLTFFADVAGILGGAASSQFLLHITPLQFLHRVRLAVDASDLFVGIIKAPVFALIIGVIGCMHGMRVRNSAASVGQETTRSVVKSIFLVIVLDALFSILFERLGL